MEPSDPAPAPFVSLPYKRPPAGAWDCHAHIYGPRDRFPLAQDAAYQPPLAPSDLYVATLDRLGMQHGVMVQGVPYGIDNRAVLDGLRRFPHRLRAVGLADAGTPGRDLEEMHALGMRGLRFSHTRRAKAASGRIGLEEFKRLAPLLRDLGWHAQLYMRVDDFVARAAELLALRVPLVLDHMGGRFAAARGPSDPDYGRMLGLLHDEDIWVKLSPHRTSKAPPGYEDVRPFHDALLATRPDRLVWGSDWPYVWMDEPPDAGHLLDLFMRWVGDAALLEGILVRNPATLYGLPAIHQT